MYITDFSHEHTAQAAALALMVYEEERKFVPSLPQVQSVPDLAAFADYGLGVAAFDDGQMTGFLCCCLPHHHSFGSTDVKGIFSPMGANAAIKENRAKIYAAMYQAAAVKWVKAGAVSHAVCLYAHDEELQRQFYHYGFGLRCMDGDRLMNPIDCSPCRDYVFTELTPKEFLSVYPLHLALHNHYCESPFFMNRRPHTQEKFMESCTAGRVRYFTANYQSSVCAVLGFNDSGETFAANGPGYIHINSAYCLPEHRGRGVYQNLLNTAISALKADGYTRIGVDFESFNPTAYRFWLKYFTAYTHGVIRRIDERILTIA